jgi:hypothetical protein
LTWTVLALRGWILIAVRPFATGACKPGLNQPATLFSVPCLILRNVRLAVVIPLGMTPGVAVAVVFEGPHGPMRIGILPLHFSQFVDEIDGLHVTLLGSSGGWTQ